MGPFQATADAFKLYFKRLPIHLFILFFVLFRQIIHIDAIIITVAVVVIYSITKIIKLALNNKYKTSYESLSSVLHEWPLMRTRVSRMLSRAI